MNDMMSVIYITQTGHVIGAVTCNSDPNRTLAPADVAGSDPSGPGFLLTAPRTIVPGPAAPEEDFFVPASVLSVSQPVPFKDAVLQLYQPQASYAMVDGVVQPLGTALAVSTVSLSKSSLSFNLASSPVSNTPVWAQIQDANPTTSPPNTWVLAASVPAGAPLSVPLSITILPGGQPTTIPSGTYSLAVMVGGYVPYFDQPTI